MPRLYLFAEGQTELTFADTVLKPHLASVGVYLPDAKSAVGPQVAELIGLNVIRSKCPHFAAWLVRLEKLGTGRPLGS